jgi:hypothetical protein
MHIVHWLDVTLALQCIGIALWGMQRHSIAIHNYWGRLIYYWRWNIHGRGLDIHSAGLSKYIANDYAAYERAKSVSMRRSCSKSGNCGKSY